MSNAFQVRPLATFRGVRHLPLLAVSHNSLFPSLVIQPDSLRIHVVRVHSLKFDEIECISLRKLLSYQLTIVPKRGWWTYSASFLADSAVRVVAALHQYAAPLAAAAIEFLRQNTRSPANGGL
jgi:hypothetical protein